MEDTRAKRIQFICEKLGLDPSNYLGDSSNNRVVNAYPYVGSTGNEGLFWLSEGGYVFNGNITQGFIGISDSRYQKYRLPSKEELERFEEIRSGNGIVVNKIKEEWDSNRCERVRPRGNVRNIYCSGNTINGEILCRQCKRDGKNVDNV